MPCPHADNPPKEDNVPGGGLGVTGDGQEDLVQGERSTAYNQGPMPTPSGLLYTM